MIGNVNHLRLSQEQRHEEHVRRAQEQLHGWLRPTPTGADDRYRRSHEQQRVAVERVKDQIEEYLVLCCQLEELNHQIEHDLYHAWSHYVQDAVDAKTSVEATVRLRKMQEERSRIEDSLVARWDRLGSGG